MSETELANSNSWEFVQKRECIDSSDDESVEVITEDSFTNVETEVARTRIVQSSLTPDKIQFNSQTDVEPQKADNECRPSNSIVKFQTESVDPYPIYSLFNFIESVIIIVAITIVGFVVTHAFVNFEGLLVSELQKYHGTNAVLYDQIKHLQKVIFELQKLTPVSQSIKANPLSSPDLYNEDDYLKSQLLLRDDSSFSYNSESIHKETINTDAIAKQSQGNIGNYINSFSPNKVTTSFCNTDELHAKISSNWSIIKQNLTNLLVSNSENLHTKIKQDISVLINQFSSAILKNALKVKTSFFTKLCSIGPFEIIKREECILHLPHFEIDVNIVKDNQNETKENINSKQISEMINDVAKDSAFSWIEFFENQFENELRKINQKLYLHIQMCKDTLKNITNSLSNFGINPSSSAGVIDGYITHHQKHDMLPNKRGEANSKSSKKSKHKSKMERKGEGKYFQDKKINFKRKSKELKHLDGNDEHKNDGIKQKDNKNIRIKYKHDDKNRLKLKDIKNTDIKQKDAKISGKKYKDTNNGAKHEYEHNKGIKHKDNENNRIKHKDSMLDYNNKFDQSNERKRKDCNCDMLKNQQNGTRKKECKCKIKKNMRKDRSWFFNMGDYRYRSDFRKNNNNTFTRAQNYLSNHKKQSDKKFNKEKINTDYKEKNKHGAGGDCKRENGCDSIFQECRHNTWFFNMGKHRSRIRTKQARSDWLFERARSRRGMKT